MYVNPREPHNFYPEGHNVGLMKYQGELCGALVRDESGAYGCNMPVEAQVHRAYNEALIARQAPYLLPLLPSQEDQEKLAAKVRRYEAFILRAMAADVDPIVAHKTVLACRHEDDPIAAAGITLCLP